MTKQTINGKAFEYSLLKEFYERLKARTSVLILENGPYLIAKKCFEGFDENGQNEYRITSNTAINFLLDVEPRLSNGIDEKDVLQLEIVSDKKGQSGDVRDVIFLRSLQKWEIGISAKNNHRAVKHSRLSMNINFGEKWLGIGCSQEYFEEIKPIFKMLASIKKSNRLSKWESIENMHQVIYIPILNAFKKELIRLDKENPKIVPGRLIQYLIGQQDFYKVIKGKRKVEIQAYNLHGTLNQPFNGIKPKIKPEKLKLPSRVIEVVYENNSTTTLLISLDEGWQISFRIHNASSKIEPSLKFDINLISSPRTLFTNHLSVSE
ncbi:MAG: HaeIII family restriction endonuclease [Bacteroidota bacterium]